MKNIPAMLFALSLSLQLTTAAERPNVLFIAIDDMKPIMSCYDDEIAITPNLEKIADGATVFLNSHCQWPVCGPSRASLMTSLRPEASGVMDLKTDMRAKNPGVLSLPQHFKNEGYTTAGVGKIYDPRCVDDKHSCDAPSWSIPFARLPYDKIKLNDVKDVFLAPDVKDEELTDGQIALIGRDTLRMLSKKPEPFFLAVGFKKPHLPFIAPKKYWELYQRDQFKLPKHQGGIKNDSGYVLHDSPEFRGYKGVPEEGPLSAALQRESIHAYYACVSFIDAQIGLLIDELRTLKLDKNTIIVVWGDHGFHLGDHDMWGKHSVLDHSARSPLLIRPAQGKVIPRTMAPVEFVDIFPTLCDLSNIPIPEGLNGRSVEPVIRGTANQVRNGALTVFKKKGATGYSYRTARYRYTEWINKFGKTVATDLFDYETDPNETENLAASPEQQARIKKLAAQLREDGQGCDRLNQKKKS